MAVDIRDHGGLYGSGKYKKGGTISFLDITPTRPLSLVSQPGVETFNQTIHAKYVSAETGHIYIPVYSYDPDAIYYYDKLGNYINFLSYNRSAFGIVMGMLEYNGFLFVFGSTGLIKYNITTRAIVQSQSGGVYQTSGGRVIRKGNKAYHSRANSISEFNLDTFTSVRSISTPNITYIQAMDDDGNFYGNSLLSNFSKYDNEGKLVFLKTGLTGSVGTNLYAMSYSKKRGSIMVAVLGSANKIFLREHSIVDGEIINFEDISALSGATTGSDYALAGVFRGFIIVKIGATTVFLSEDDLSLLYSGGGIIGTNENRFGINDKVVASGGTQVNTATAYIMELK